MKKRNNFHEDVVKSVMESVPHHMARIKTLKEPSLAESFRESFENPTFILSSIVVVVAALRFLFDGAVLEVMGQSITFAHTDPMAYVALLTPVLGAHSFIRAKAKITQMKEIQK